MTHNTTLVLGGNGKTGRRVVERLSRVGVDTRVGSRSAAPPFDWDKSGTWAAALRSVDQVYVTYQPDLAFPGAVEKVQSFVAAATAAGVGRLVLLSGRNEPGALLAEHAVRESGAAWTVVRSSMFSQNFSEAFLLEPLLEGELVFPADEVLEPFVDADDIADVVTAALTDDRHAGQLYEVTGPRLLTFASAIGEIATAAERPIRYVPVTIAEYVEGMVEAGIPQGDAVAYAELFSTVLDGRNEYVADGVERALSRPARDFTDYVRDTARTGVWATPAAVG